jgi:hypothetical protein
MFAGELMDQGFGPKLSRVAAGVCFLVLGFALQYFFGQWVLIAVLFMPLLMALLLTVTLPKSSRKNRIIGLVSRSVDIGLLVEWLEDRFDKLTTR